MVGGIQRVEADLREIELSRFALVGGSERIQLELGAAVGRVPIKIMGGASTVRLERPAAVPIGLSISGGAKSILMDGTRIEQKGGRTTTESAGWAAAKSRYDIELVGGAKSIEVVGRP
jgi:hypothetical protein